MSIPLQRVTSLRGRAQANAPVVASCWLSRVLVDGGRRDQTSPSRKSCWGRNLQCTIALLRLKVSHTVRYITGWIKTSNINHVKYRQERFSFDISNDLWQKTSKKVCDEIYWFLRKSVVKFFLILFAAVFYACCILWHCYHKIKICNSTAIAANQFVVPVKQAVGCVCLFGWHLTQPGIWIDGSYVPDL